MKLLWATKKDPQGNNLTVTRNMLYHFQKSSMFELRATEVEYFTREFLGEQKIKIASLLPFLVGRWRWGKARWPSDGLRQPQIREAAAVGVSSARSKTCLCERKEKHPSVRLCGATKTCGPRRIDYHVCSHLNKSCFSREETSLHRRESRFGKLNLVTKCEHDRQREKSKPCLRPW